MFEFCFVFLVLSANLELVSSQRWWNSPSNVVGYSRYSDYPSTSYQHIDVSQGRLGMAIKTIPTNATNKHQETGSQETGSAGAGGKVGKPIVSFWSNPTVTDPPLGPHDRINTTDIPEEIEARPDKTVAERRILLKRMNPTWTKKQINDQIARDDKLRAEQLAKQSGQAPNKNKGYIPIPSYALNQFYPSTRSPNVAGWAGGPTTEPALGPNDRMNTTDVPEEIEARPDKTRAERRLLLKRMNPSMTAEQIEAQLAKDDKARARMAATQSEPVVVLPEPPTRPPPVTKRPKSQGKSRSNTAGNLIEKEQPQQQQTQNNDQNGKQPIVRNKQTNGRFGQLKAKPRKIKAKPKRQRRPPPTTTTTTSEPPTPPTTLPPSYPPTTEPYFPTTYPTYPTNPSTRPQPGMWQQNRPNRQNQPRPQQQWNPPRRMQRPRSRPRPRPRPRLIGSELSHILSIVG